MAQEMPSGPAVCHKCRSGDCAGSDTWCELCSSASALSEAAKVRFTSKAHRKLAEEICVQAARQVSALISLDRQVQGQTASLSDRLRNAQGKLSELTEQLDQTAGAKSKPKRPIPAVPVQPPVKVEEPEEADYGSESFAESEEEESEEREATGASGSAVKRTPRSPSQPPPRRKEGPKERKVSRSRDRGRRGGKKHQGHHRALQEPNRVFHRKPNYKIIDEQGRPKGDFYSRR